MRKSTIETRNFLFSLVFEVYFNISLVKRFYKQFLKYILFDNFILKKYYLSVFYRIFFLINNNV